MARTLALRICIFANERWQAALCVETLHDHALVNARIMRDGCWLYGERTRRRGARRSSMFMRNAIPAGRVLQHNLCGDSH
jgi:hypothetical protein